MRGAAAGMAEVQRVLVVNDIGGLIELTLESEHYSIGRARDNDIRLKATTVSSYHAALVLKDGHYWLEDLLSTNGCFVNRRRVQRSRLDDGDQILLGDCGMTYLEVKPVPRGARTTVYSGAMLETRLRGSIRQRNERHRARKGETGEIPFRTGRFFNVGGEWFFATREGKDEGPFESLDQARAALTEYGRKLGFLAGFDDERYR